MDGSPAPVLVRMVTENRFSKDGKVWRRERDSNPRRHKDAVDFESTPFGHSGISPHVGLQIISARCAALGRTSAATRRLLLS